VTIPGKQMATPLHEEMKTWFIEHDFKAEKN